MLLLLDLITDEQFRNSSKNLADHPEKNAEDIFLTDNMVQERPLLMTLSYHLDIPYIEPHIDLIDRSLCDKVSTAFLRRLEAVPISSDGESVMVVARNPTRENLAREFRDLWRKPIQFAVGPRSAILQTLNDLDRLRINPDEGEKDTVISIVNYYLGKATRMGASDLHFEPMHNRVRIRFRIDGVLQHIGDLPLYMAAQIASRLKILAKSDIIEKRKHQSGRIFYEVDNSRIDMRVSVYVTVHGENVVIRILNAKTGIVPLERIGFFPALLREYREMVLDGATGVVLITGPTGSGKTTTLYSSIGYCNNIDLKIITVEDPVEYVIDGVVQCNVDVKAGRDFTMSLREIVRQDPDIIVLGEIRDKETAETAIQAALTGHKVFATFHTEDSVGGLIRLIDMNIEAFLISSTIVCVIAQRLVRRICMNCRVSTEPTPYELRVLGIPPEQMNKYKLYKGAGCAMCQNSGYKGRVGIYEMLLINDPIRAAILDKKPSYKLREIAIRTNDLLSMEEDGIAKAMQGVTTLEELVRNVPRSYKIRNLDEIQRRITAE